MHLTAKIFYLIGPSGSGKDTILNHLKKTRYFNAQPQVAHRYITRATRAKDENHIELSVPDFKQRKQAGLFLFDWQSHGCQYAIGAEVKLWRDSGQHVIVNGSREYLPCAREIYPDLVPVWVSVTDDTIRKRLIGRGRESDQEITVRMQRNQILENMVEKDGFVLNNDRTVEAAIMQLQLVVENVSAPHV